MTASEMKKYKLVEKKGEGTFSEVVKAQNIEEGSFHAIKCMKASMESIHQVNNLREIQALRKLTPHANIISLQEVLYDEPSGRLAMVFELMDANLYDLIRGRREHLDSNLILNLGYQMFTGLQHMHSNGIFHRDIKPENILIDDTRKVLKIADLGSCRGVYNKPPFTEYIATRWYRSPECLLTDGYYGAEMDIWGAGTVLFEIISLFPLFPGSDEVDQINRIHKIMGTPNSTILGKLRKKSSTMNKMSFAPEEGIGIKHFIPHASSSCVDLLKQTLIYDFTERITAKQCLLHPYFEDERKRDSKLKKSANVNKVSNSTSKTNTNTTSSNVNDSSGKVEVSSKPVASHKPAGHVGKKKVAPNTTKTGRTSPTKETSNPPVKQITTKSTKQARTNTKPVRKSTKPVEKPKEPRKPVATRRPGRLSKLTKKEDTRTTKKTTNRLSKPSNTTTSKPSMSKPTKTKNKYANITSSGYGSSAYKPTTKKPGLAKKKTDTASTAASSVTANPNAVPKMKTRMERKPALRGTRRRLPAIRG